MCASTPHLESEQAQALSAIHTTHSSKPSAESIWIRLCTAAWSRCLALLLIAIATHSPSLQGQRIWDDQYLTQDNPMIKSPWLIIETFRHYLFLDSFSAHYRPMQNISMMFDYFFWNTNEFGFHLTNILLHALSGMLLYFLLRRIFVALFAVSASSASSQSCADRQRWSSHAAFIVALLWLVHPVHSAAIDYISGRADSLAFVFAAGGWLLFERAQKASTGLGRAVIYALAAISGLLALLSREIALVWVFIFVLYLIGLRRNLNPVIRIGGTVCCLVLVFVYVSLRQLPGHRGIGSPQTGLPAPVRATLMARSLGDYARLMVLPVNLHMERTVFDPRDWETNTSWQQNIAAEYLSILGVLALAVFVFGAIKQGSGQTARWFGAAWFFAAYLPVSNIVQLNASVAEHWLYLPSVGFLIFLFGWAREIKKDLRPLVFTVALLWGLALSGRTFIRSGDWSNEETFYKRTLEAGSQSARAAINLGQVFAARHAYADAERIFRLVLDQNPDYPIAQNNLADVLYRQGKTDEAEKLFAEIERNSERTRQEFARSWIGAMNLAALRHNSKDDASALTILDKACRDYPDVWDLVALESEILRRQNRIDAAIALVKDFSDRNWWHHGAAFALGQLYAQKGASVQAEAFLLRAARLDLHDAAALRSIVLLRLNQNRMEEALRLQKRAIARQPDQPSQYLLLSDILEKMGRDTEAHAILAQVSRMRALAVASPNQSL